MVLLSSSIQTTWTVLTVRLMAVSWRVVPSWWTWRGDAHNMTGNLDDWEEDWDKHVLDTSGRTTHNQVDIDLWREERGIEMTVVVGGTGDIEMTVSAEIEIEVETETGVEEIEIEIGGITTETESTETETSANKLIYSIMFDMYDMYARP